MQEKKYLPLFKVLSTHGLKGDLKVALLSFNTEIINNLKILYLKDKWDEPLEIAQIKKGPGFNVFILKLKDFDYERAGELVNKTLYIDFEALPRLSEEEFYYYELEGLTVKDEKGKVWGKVVEVMPMGEYELLLVRDEKKREFYIPLVEEYVEKVEPEEGLILVRDIEALVESQL
ncbi:MAG: ribosome maturation factor RimM [Caldimicrobium sp.]